MSWSLNASGHTDPDTERQLAAAVGQVLGQAGDAVGNASFSGQAFAGDPRSLAGTGTGEETQEAGQ